MLGIGRSTLYLFIAAGEIATLKLGRSTLVPVAGLKSFVERRTAAERAGTGTAAPDDV